MKKETALKSKVDFLKEGLKNLMTVGAVARSSQFLCEEMTSAVNFDTAIYLVEIGAGDGVITKHILEKMRPDAKLLSFEVNDTFIEILKEIQDPRFILIHDSAENIEKHVLLHFQRPESVDAIISALPFVLIPEELTQRILDACKASLKKGGLFIQYHYSMVLKKLYKKVFGNVQTLFEPLNIPPAFIFICEKK